MTTGYPARTALLRETQFIAAQDTCGEMPRQSLTADEYALENKDVTMEEVNGSGVIHCVCVPGGARTKHIHY
ncbi:hypothetical protein FKM82_000061 [Ascaphus truei]